jgi:hypothetical protein
MSAITGVPTARSLNLRTSENLATAITNPFFETEMFSFMGNTVQKEYLASNKKDSIQVKIKPQLTEPVNITAYSETKLTQSDYEQAAYGKIDVKLDYGLSKRFKYDSIDLAFVAENEERDLTESALIQNFRRMKRTINMRLRTSAFAENFGVANTAINIKTLSAIRQRANIKGYQNKFIEVRLNPVYWDVATSLVEFQTIGGFVPVAGNTASANTTIAPTVFEVRGKYNMRFISDDTYDVTTPATDPKGTAYVDVSAVVPIRGLEVADPDKDFPIFDPNTGINALYSRDTDKVNLGRKVMGAIEFLYGFKELSGDINQAGVIQTAPIWNVMGGTA